jgi:hypothetical protein
MLIIGILIGIPTGALVALAGIYLYGVGLVVCEDPKARHCDR